MPNEKVALFIEGDKNAKDYQTDARGEFKLEIDPSARIYAATEWRVSCTPVKAENIPYVPVSEIIQEGFICENACGHARSEVIKDKLVIFARKASSLRSLNVSFTVVPPKNGTNNKAPVCFAQLKSRPVNDPTASKVDALHTFWWVQGTNGRAVLSAGPQSYHGGSNPYLEAWVVPGNSNGANNSGQHLVFNTGVSSDVCGQVGSMINSASQFPRRTIYYNPVWGPNSNTAAKYFGNTAGFQPSFPFNAYGGGAPLLVP